MFEGMTNGQIWIIGFFSGLIYSVGVIIFWEIVFKKVDETKEEIEKDLRDLKW